MISSMMPDLQEHGAGWEGGEAAVAVGAALEIGAQDAQQHEEGGDQHAAVRQARRRHVAVRAPVLAHQVLHQLRQPVGHVLLAPCNIIPPKPQPICLLATTRVLACLVLTLNTDAILGKNGFLGVALSCTDLLLRTD